jgi:nucleotide-binding universal stress UspA family protein
MFRRILVGFDGSDGARRAARVALAFASDVAGEAKVLVVIPPPVAETDEDRRQAFEAEAGPLRRMVEQELTLTEHARASTSIDVISDAHPAVDFRTSS